MLTLGPIFNLLGILTSTPAAAVSISPTLVTASISTRRPTEAITVIIRAARDCWDPPTAAPAVVNSARGRNPAMTFTWVVSQSVLWPRCNTPSWMLMGSTNKVHCYHYIFSLIRKPLSEQILAHGRRTPGILAEFRWSRPCSLPG